MASFFERKIQQRKKITSALTYPVIILSTAILVVIFLLRFVVPMLSDVFQQYSNKELPALTQYVISASAWISNYGWFVVLGVALVWIGYYSIRKKANTHLTLKSPPQ
ncbi:MAG: hypothetical protein KKA07_18740 [Bacteroidetes bacterium]|nr:hypothetical protein [Bacteroidota bacterium]